MKRTAIKQTWMKTAEVSMADALWRGRFIHRVFFDLKDSHNAFWCVTLSANRNFVYKNKFHRVPLSWRESYYTLQHKEVREAKHCKTKLPACWMAVYNVITETDRAMALYCYGKKVIPLPSETGWETTSGFFSAQRICGTAPCSNSVLP